MEEIGAMILIWVVHAGIAAVLSSPIIFFGRKRVQWRLWELLISVIPFTVWTLLSFSELAMGKSLANLGEPFYFAPAIPALAFIRVAVGSRFSETLCAVVLIAVMCLIAAGVFFVVPPLPE
ncbi:MAG: hypothetical protein WEB58_13800 [Planctomycetaceae bacterium]